MMITLSDQESVSFLGFVGIILSSVSFNTNVGDISFSVRTTQHSTDHESVSGYFEPKRAGYHENYNPAVTEPIVSVSLPTMSIVPLSKSPKT